MDVFSDTAKLDLLSIKLILPGSRSLVIQDSPSLSANRVVEPWVCQTEAGVAVQA
jgi:hypothetical protein